MVNEIIFLVEEALEGGYTARALGHSIFTEGDTLEAIREEVKEAVRCHFDDAQGPQIIRAISKEELINKLFTG